MSLQETFVAKSEDEFQNSQRFEALTQLLSQKKELLQCVKGTFLWELLLGMDFLVGSINGVELTPDPFSYTDFLVKDRNKFIGPGINKVLDVQLTKEDLYWWNTFYLEIPILDSKLNEIDIKKYHTLQVYILIRIMPEVKPNKALGYPGKKKQIRYLIFSIYNDSNSDNIKKKIIGSEQTHKVLNSSEQIKNIKRILKEQNETQLKPPKITPNHSN